MSYKHLTIDERLKIEVLHKEGYKISRIAEIIKCHRSTIYRELKRCQVTEYVAKVVQQEANKKTMLKGCHPKYNPDLLEAIQEKLELTWSPEQIIGREYPGKLTFKTIHNWIYQGALAVLLTVLR